MIQPNTGSAFGSTTATGQPNQFGSTSQSTGSVFGQASATTAADPTAQPKLFGSSSGPGFTSQSTGAVFGQTTLQIASSTGQSVFGSTAHSAFGSANTFGNKVQTQNYNSTASNLASSNSNSIIPKLSTYTPIDQLTADEKEQFVADRFILGKIPLKPPPKELI